MSKKCAFSFTNINQSNRIIIFYLAHCISQIFFSFGHRLLAKTAIFPVLTKAIRRAILTERFHWYAASQHSFNHSTLIQLEERQASGMNNYLRAISQGRENSYGLVLKRIHSPNGRTNIIILPEPWHEKGKINHESEGRLKVGSTKQVFLINNILTCASVLLDHLYGHEICHFFPLLNHYEITALQNSEQRLNNYSMKRLFACVNQPFKVKHQKMGFDCILPCTKLKKKIQIGMIYTFGSSQTV